MPAAASWWHEASPTPAGAAAGPGAGAGAADAAAAAPRWRLGPDRPVRLGSTHARHRSAGAAIAAAGAGDHRGHGTAGLGAEPAAGTRARIAELPPDLEHPQRHSGAGRIDPAPAGAAALDPRADLGPAAAPVDRPATGRSGRGHRYPLWRAGGSGGERPARCAAHPRLGGPAYGRRACRRCPAHRHRPAAAAGGDQLQRLPT